ncbi:hypothetical protein [Streptomyces sp. NPDC055287]
MKSRDTASSGYQQALAAHQAAVSERRVDTAIAAAVERQNLALQQQRERAFADDPTALEQLRERARQKVASRRRELSSRNVRASWHDRRAVIIRGQRTATKTPASMASRQPSQDG